MSAQLPVWYFLVDERGDPAFEGVGAQKVKFNTEENADVADLTTEVWKTNQKIIDGVAGQLTVYSNKEDIGDRTKVLEADAPLKGMGEGKATSLLVVVPESPASKKQRKEKPTWRDETPPVYSLEDHQLYFVNRTDAILQLQKIHQAKFKRAFWGSGPEWIIPIADNVLGLGKSAFGRNYIRKSRETWPNVAERDDFQKTLCGCHTVAIEFGSGALLEDSFNAVMIKLLCDALIDMFDTPPAILSMPPKSARNLLKDLTDVCGPVFIVLDEIGKAFHQQIDPLDDMKQREMFLSFCEHILDSWLSLKNVFFVVLGRASFLNHVGLRPLDTQHHKVSRFIFERLNIHLLRSEAILDIMDKTLISPAQPDTISTHLCPTAELSQKIANHLFHQTNGHPRTLLAIFKKCKTYDEIMNCNEPPEIRDWKPFYDKLCLNNFNGEVIQLLKDSEAGEEVDLSKMIKDAGGKSTPRENIATNSFFAWEGTLEKARLYVHPIVKALLENYVLPFRVYLQHVGNTNRVSIDHANVFEWMFLKRFQEIFTEPKNPSLVLPAFFNSPKFGGYKSVSFSSLVRRIPKITSAGSKTPELDSSTAHPDCWRMLLDSLDSGPICLKPLAKSASSDAILIGSATDQFESIVLTVGLAVKNYGSTAFSLTDLLRECFLFDRMFNGTTRKGRNVLFICCTHYVPTIMEEFKMGNSFAYQNDDYPNIDEVVVLNLSDEDLRQEFFGLEKGSKLSGFVENVVKKAEVEYEDVK
ncbi:hypothetical protein BDR26DRAFT_1011589 [Obelidium mucronatum]|nr:hypothetical protein BDR26DRAFT_1011589 [Obelidium mucronatum]